MRIAYTEFMRGLNYPLESLAFFVLSLAFLSFWIFSNKKIPLSIFIISTLLSFFSGIINSKALLPSILIGTLFYFFYKKSLSNIARSLVSVVLFVLVTFLFLHKIPGYNNWEIYSDIKLTQKSVPFSLWFNFDKALLGFFILFFAFEPARKISQYKEIFLKGYPFLIFIIILSCLVGLYTNYVIYEPKLPDIEICFFWFIKMLFFTVLVEELFFRFFVQNYLINIFGDYKSAKEIGLILSTVIFALFHISGGVSFVLLAFICGLIYGGVYLRTKHLESAIFIHLCLNTIHFFFFSYPSYLKI